MSKKLVRYIVLIAVAGLLAYNSVYFKKLDAKEKTATTVTNLNPVETAQQFWSKQFPAFMDSAVEVNEFFKILKENPKQVFEKYSRTQGIGNNSFFLIKGEGTIESVNEDDVMVLIKPGTTKIKLSTGVYFGNAVRDVTGKIAMGDFTNTMDFNTVSTELNKIVRTQVITPFKTKAVKGAAIQFIGCAEINKEQINIDHIQLLPVKIVMP